MLLRPMSCQLHILAHILASIQHSWQEADVKSLYERDVLALCTSISKNVHIFVTQPHPSWQLPPIKLETVKRFLACTGRHTSLIVNCGPDAPAGSTSISSSGSSLRGVP